MVNNQTERFTDFYTAREFSRSLGKNTKAEWKRYTVSGDKPSNIPACPETVYEEFDGYADWLGNGKSKPVKQDFRTYEEVEQYLCLHGIRIESQWRGHIKNGLKPADIPSSLSHYYKKDGFTWKIFHKLIPKYLSYEKAQRYMQENEPDVKSASAYERYSASGRRPKFMPSKPSEIYKDDGFTWGGFLGTGRVASQKKKLERFPIS